MIRNYNYTYCIINKENNKHYIGVRTSYIPPLHDLGVSYFSSSTNKEFIKDQEINSQNYEYKIIGIFPTRELAILNEIELHEAYNVGKNQTFYNKTKQTSTGFNTTGVKLSEIHKRKISPLGRKHTKETIKKMSDTAKYKRTRQTFSEKGKLNMSNSRIRYLNNSPEEAIENCRKGRLGKGRIIQQFDLDMVYLKECTYKVFIDEGFNLGRISECCNGKRDKYKNYKWRYK